MLTRDQILTRIRERVHHPATSRELMQALRVPRQERPTFRRLLRSLVADGELLQIRGNRFGLADRMDVVVGRLQMHHAGFGFVVADTDSEADDVYIAPTNIKEALHGDRVIARVERVRGRERAEGRIIRILERANATVVGRLDVDDPGLAFVVPFDRRVLTDVQIARADTRAAASGDMVVVEITRWPTATRPPAGRVIEVLGPLGAPGVDARIVIRKHGLPDGHGEEAIEEAKRLGTSVRRRDLAGRRDFRGLLTVTIDGEHARDFDDAITLERLANGRFWLGVHIADVSHYVEEGSALDVEAYERGTSVYFPERALHMFPPELATGLCSLNPGVDRLVQSCQMEVSRTGEVVRAEFHDGVIHSDARMTYTAVNAILAGEDPKVRRAHAPLVPLLELMHELFAILNGRRRRRGSIDFDLPEAEVLMDAAGEIENIIVAERNVAHRIIEEFMLLANETVADHLDAGEGPGLYRIHEEPDPVKVGEFEEFIAGLGHSLGAPPNSLRPRHFQRLVERIRGTPEEKPIALLMLKTMQKARYAPEDLGHFGLAAPSYTHFTSPIRRYPDLVVHRLLRARRQGRLDDARREEIEEDLPEIARHTSQRERLADEAERELLQWRKVRFMADKVGDEFDGFVTGVTTFGLFVELIEHFVEGLVHISSMADDYYRFLESGHALRGENTQKVYRLGDRVRVQVIRVDLERRQVDLGLAEILDAVREDERHRGPRRSSAAPKRDQRRPNRRPGRRERATRKAVKGRGRK